MTVELDQQCINTLRFLSVDMVQAANSGHPGLPFGAASLAYVLWTRGLKLNPRNPGWVDRDRFVLSAGHGSALLYALLYLTGYDLSLDDLRQFRQWGSKAPGHPERGHTPGVETTTGPLGQGMVNAVGMAIAEAQLAARYNRPDHGIIDHHTFALVSDGDLMEGVVAEAASLAGHLELGKLICLYDDNSITLAAGTDITFSVPRTAHPASGERVPRQYQRDFRCRSAVRRARLFRPGLECRRNLACLAESARAGGRTPGGLQQRKAACQRKPVTRVAPSAPHAMQKNCVWQRSPAGPLPGTVGART